MKLSGLFALALSVSSVAAAGLFQRDDTCSAVLQTNPDPAVCGLKGRLTKKGKRDVYYAVKQQWCADKCVCTPGCVVYSWRDNKKGKHNGRCRVFYEGFQALGFVANPNSPRIWYAKSCYDNVPDPSHMTTTSSIPLKPRSTPAPKPVDSLFAKRDLVTDDEEFEVEEDFAAEVEASHSNSSDADKAPAHKEVPSKVTGSTGQQPIAHSEAFEDELDFALLI